MRLPIALTLLALAPLAACSGTPRHERDAQTLARLSQYAGEPVHDFRYYSPIRSFQPLSRDKVLVSTGFNDSYLLTVFPCMNLEFATRIGLTSSLGAVRSGFDSVLVEGERCRISEIRPVNTKQMRADAKESGESPTG